MNPAMVVALTLYLEAGGEPIVGREMVATVIVNRARERGLTPDQVCLQPKQFSCWNGTPPMIVIDEIPVNVWRHCLRLADEIIAGTYLPLNDATHYYNPELCTPSWSSSMEVVTKRGGHIFLKENRA